MSMSAAARRFRDDPRFGGDGARSGRGGYAAHGGGVRGGGRGSFRGAPRGGPFARRAFSADRKPGPAGGLRIGAATRMREADDAFDASMGFARFEAGPDRIGYLFNMLPTVIVSEDGSDRAALDMYFIQQDGETFKGTVMYEPYFFVGLHASASDALTREVMSVLERRFEGLISGLARVEKEDLEMLNHLSGRQHEFIQLRFKSVSELMTVRSHLKPIIDRNVARLARTDLMEEEEERAARADAMNKLVDLREYDVPYYMRVSIDCSVRVGSWYQVAPTRPSPCVKLTHLKDMLVTAEPRILAFDIETTKAPLKFPDAKADMIYMISYMLDGRGHLIINRAIVSQDVPDFEYTPRPDFRGEFTVVNVPDEQAVLRRFFDHVREVRPNIFVTYNGDFFDWPFVEARAAVYGMSMREEIGVTGDGGEYRGRTAVHLDCLYWVKRDSYLPQGSHGLKSVTREKLGYDPVEIDPEDMLSMATTNPLHMASYSVSDAVATYYLYAKYVHNFVFSLCTIIPMNAEDVLRKGSGTLCESLLMVEAYRRGIICPNKQQDAHGRSFEGHLLDTETYLGGHVECLESGVFRCDLPTEWRLTPSAFDELICKIDRALTFALEVEHGIERATVLNYDEVRSAIIEKLELLRDAPVRIEKPVIYHLDVAAMYPNIILTNRLQPCAVVTQDTCAACDFNDPVNKCQRRMEWMWRGEYFPATREEVESIRAQLFTETVDELPFTELSLERQEELLKARLKTYCQKVYKHVKDTTEQLREATICQRENPFYVDTVRAFRDRRYEYKGLTKGANNELKAAEKAGDKLAAEAARGRYVLYDSLQLAHKCILNSFYGYVMRRGARWHSMEMAGVVTYTGSQLIQQARTLVEQVGRPLEIDTDGIWCMLPASFPQNFDFQTPKGKLTISYPCVMLNADVHDNYTNHQYQDLTDSAARSYRIKSECSIFFELDGPHAAMVLPASTEEGKLLKKRYAVFSRDGSLSELKGFEMKRRGELKMIKVFQSQVFERFLDGSTLEECYDSVAGVANYWLNILDTQGEDLDDDELIDFLSENRSMTRTLDDYGEQKSVAISTAKRLAEFLGGDMVKDKGLACKLLVAKKPAGAPVTERAIPTTIFSAEPSIMRHYLRKWCKDSSMSDFNIRSILDWDYYRTRLAAVIQKIITIPAALQKVANPVPRVAHPDWLLRAVHARSNAHKQLSLTALFAAGAANAALAGGDIEDAVPGKTTSTTAPRVTSKKARTAFFNVADAPSAPAASTDAPPGDAPAARESAMTESHTTPIDVELPTAPPITQVHGQDQFESWLQVRKAEWRAQRAATKRQRAQVDTDSRAAPWASADTPKEAGGSRKVRQAKIQLLRGPSTSALLESVSAGSPDALRGYWQIVEVRDRPGAPGCFTVFAFTSPRHLQAFQVTVPRTLVLNRFTAVPSETMGETALQPVQKRLPHDAPAFHVYELRLSESRFQRRIRHVTQMLEDPDIAGVYETQMPLPFRALLGLGCVTQLGVRAALPRSVLVQERRTAAAAAAPPGTHDDAAAEPVAGGAAGMPDQSARDRKRVLAEQIMRRKSAAPSRAGRKSTLEAFDFVASARRQPSVAPSLYAGHGAAAAVPFDRDVRSLAAAMPTFQLEDLEHLTTSTHPYLSPIASAYRFAFVYHSHDEAGRCGTTMLFVSKTTSSVAYDRAVTELTRKAKEAGTLSDGTMQSLQQEAAGLVAGLDVPVEYAVTCFLTSPGVEAAAKAVATSRRTSGGLAASMAASAAGLPRPHLKTHFERVRAGLHAHAETTAEFRVVYVNEQQDVWRRVSAALRDVREQPSSRAAVIACASVSVAPTQLLQMVPALDDIPVIAMPFLPVDNAYRSTDWWNYATIRGIKRFFESLSWWPQCVDAARYAQIPVANLVSDGVERISRTTAMSPDTPTAAITQAMETSLYSRIADVFFGRILNVNKHVLWASMSAVPDLGGTEADASLTSSLATFAALTSSRAARPAGDAPELSASASHALSVNPTVCVPGMYRGVCVLLNMEHLALNAVLNASTVSDLDGADALHAAEELLAGDGGPATTSTSGPDGSVPVAMAIRFARSRVASSVHATALGAFKTLRKLLSNWLSDLRSTGNVWAEQLLRRFYVWLASPASLLHDPALHRMVHALMKRMFDQLCKALRSLGCVVVYGSLTRLLLHINKPTMSAAATQLQHVLRKVLEQPAFSLLEIVPVQWWRQLLFLDVVNFGGVRVNAANNAVASAPGADIDIDAWSNRLIVSTAKDGALRDADWAATERAFVTDATSSIVYDKEWNLRDYLTPVAANAFTIVIGHYMMRPMRERARRLFRRMRAKFQTFVETALLASPIAASLAMEGLAEDVTPLPRRPLRENAENTASSDGDEVESGSSDERAEPNLDDSEAELSDAARANDVDEADDSPLRDTDGALHATPAAGTPQRGARNADPVAVSTGKQMDGAAIRALLRSVTKQDEEDEAEAETAFMSEFVSQWLRDRLVECVHEIQSIEGAADEEPDSSDPLRSARRTASTLADTLGAMRRSPALAFTASVCHVLCLDETIRSQVTAVQATLLAMQHVGEFSAAARYVDPCATFVLPDIVCTACQRVRDVDLSRDPCLRATVPANGDDVVFSWSCDACGAEYDNAMLEFELVRVVEARAMAYQVQDVVCARCRRTRASPLRPYCDCGGKFGNADSAGQFIAFLRLFFGLATAFRMQWLQDTSGALLRGNHVPL